MFNRLIVAVAVLTSFAAAVLAQDPSSCIKSAAGHALADCAFGYGAGAVGGKGGVNYVVTSNADDGSAGTLRAILKSFKGVAGGKWITFPQGQTFTITLTEKLDIKSDSGNDYVTIDGRGSTVIITGAGINIFKVSNVIVHGITIKNVIAKEDLLQISEASNVWVDHVSFSNEAWGSPYPSEGSYPDGACDVTNESTGVTISFSKFDYHNKTMLLGNSDSKTEDAVLRVTVAFNYFGGHIGQRVPRMRYGQFDVANNYYESDQLVIGGSSDPAALIRNNVFNPSVGKNIFYQPADDAVVSFFISGNVLLNGAVDNYASILHGSRTTFSPGYAWTPIAASSVRAIVTANAGAGNAGSSAAATTTTTTTRSTTTTTRTTTSSVAPSSSTTTTRASTTTTTTRASTTTTTTRASTTTTTAAATTASSCAALYAQCGGLGWTGATCCVSGTCTVANTYYSQCL